MVSNADSPPGSTPKRRSSHLQVNNFLYHKKSQNEVNESNLIKTVLLLIAELLRLYVLYS